MTGWVLFVIGGGLLLLFLWLIWAIIIRPASRANAKKDQTRF